MRVLVISGRTARQPWTHGAMTAAICRGLAERGHVVMLAAQSVDDPAMFDSCYEVHAFDSFDQTATDWPLGFSHWARGERQGTEHDVSLSLSRVAAGDVWMPLEPSGGAWLARVRRSHGLVSQGIAIARHHGAIRAWASDTFFVTPPTGEDEPIRRVLAVGSTATGEVARALHRARGLGDRVVKMEPFAATERPPDSDMRAARQRVRGMLGIAPEQRVVLVSAPTPVGGLLDGLLRAVKDRAVREGHRGPVLLALSRDCFALEMRAQRRGAGANVRVLGVTSQMADALSAADAVALPTRSARGLFENGGANRLGADALRFGRALLAVSGAPGYAMARLRAADGTSPGMVLDTSDRGEWERALAQLANQEWLDQAARAARELGEPMTFARFAKALEETLREAANERAGVREG